MTQEYFGKYRGRVINNVDPLQLGRVQVSCPDVLGENVLSWAMPSVPYAGMQVGFFFIPPMGANIWVEFEAGQPSKPIWTGCFWNPGEVPAIPAIAENKVLQVLGAKLVMNEVPGIGGVTIEVGPPIVAVPLTIKLDSTGISVVNGKASVELSPVSVSVNKGALEVI